jgi:hypothetical protein
MPLLQLPLAQSPFPRQATQLPLPLQNLPPPAEVQEVPEATLEIWHMALVLQMTVLQVPGLGHWLVAVQPAQLPAPSQARLLPQLVPAGSFIMTTCCIEQELATQGLLLGGTSRSAATVCSVPPTHFCVWQSLTVST